MKKSYLPFFVLGILTIFTGQVFGESKAKGFIGNISELSVQNKDFRQVLYTGKNVQLVLMALKPGEDIGEEVHEKVDQFFRIEAGSGMAIINGKQTSIKMDDAVIVPAGSKHNIVNNGKVPLQFYSLYSPPHHKDKTVHKTKAEATNSKEKFDGQATE